MFTNKISGCIAVLTGTTVILQLLMLMNTSCNTYSGVQLARMEASRQQITLTDTKTVLQVNRTVVLPKYAANITETSQELPGLQTETKRRLTIGIPTVKRRDGSYFLTMLDSMLNNTRPEHLKEIVFVICLAENNNITWKQDMETYLKKKYHKYVEVGSLMVIHAPLSFYKTMPDFGNNNYMTWRTKQNFDYAYMMKYSRHLSEYYMQMEDDVITRDDYYPAILDYIEQLRNQSWVCLEFSELGFIGKLYRSSELVRLADMLLMFNSSAPVDYTFIYFNYLSGQTTRFLRKPTLFQHLGVQSSLVNKIQPLQDKFFDYPEKELSGDNPPAKLYTSLKTSPDFPPDLAYRNVRGHFWSDGGAQLNDHFTIVFEQPQLLKGVVIITGGKYIPDDIFYSAIVESSPIAKGENECGDYVTIGEFQTGRANISETAIKTNMSNFKTVCLRIRVTNPQIQWIIIKEIAVFVK